MKGVLSRPSHNGLNPDTRISTGRSFGPGGMTCPEYDALAGPIVARKRKILLDRQAGNIKGVAEIPARQPDIDRRIEVDERHQRQGEIVYWIYKGQTRILAFR